MKPPSSIEPLEARIAPAFAANYDLGKLTAAQGSSFGGAENHYDLRFQHDKLGYSVANAGDVNGDGFADVIVGAPYRNDHYADTYSSQGGAVFVVFGGPKGLPADLKPSDLNGQNGFRLTGEAKYDHAGISVSAAGDVNGDGFDDIIIGAVNRNQSGAAYVVFGKAGGFPAEMDLSALNGTNGFKLTGRSFESTGLSVSGAGDVNGDGFADVIIGAPDDSGVSHAYVVFGKAGGFAPSVDLTALNGTDGFALMSGNGEFAGSSVSGAGDINGDGFADVIVGARYASPNGTDSGSAYVIFGHAGTFSANFNLATVNGSNGFRIDGSASNDRAGEVVRGIGDINGDGVADFFVEGGPAVSVFFGHTGSFPAKIDLSSVNGANGFGVNYGGDAANAGDVNGDGIQDLIIGDFGASVNGTYSGAAFVLFGKTGGFSAQVDLSKLNGHDGFRLSGANGYDYAGRSVSGGGDINGDGFPDLIIGAPLGVPGHGTGQAYIVYGGDPGRLHIAKNGHTATYTDPDGDLVKVQTSTGVLTAGMFDMRAEGFGFQLQTLNITDPAFAKANLSFIATPENVDGIHGKEGNGTVDVGYLNATGLDLGIVKIHGDLGQIDAGNPSDPSAAIRLLKVQSLGALGTATQDPAAPSLHSDIDGTLNMLYVAHNIGSGETLAIAGKLGPTTIGGSLDGATLSVLGTLAPVKHTDALAIASLSIGGHIADSQILVGYDLTGAAMNPDVDIGSVIVGGSWSASSVAVGIADSTQDGFGQNDTLIPGGNDAIIASIASITIKGTATGSAATGDFFGITAEVIKKAKIHGIALALTANKDDLLLDSTNSDFRLVEVQDPRKGSRATAGDAPQAQVGMALRAVRSSV